MQLASRRGHYVSLLFLPLPLSCLIPLCTASLCLCNILLYMCTSKPEAAWIHVCDGGECMRSYAVKLHVEVIKISSRNHCFTWWRGVYHVYGFWRYVHVPIQFLNIVFLFVKNTIIYIYYLFKMQFLFFLNKVQSLCMIQMGRNCCLCS